MRNEGPKLSILIPTYNRQNFVVDAIESVLNQSFQDYEIICSDNASTDDTLKVLNEYAKRDKRIKVFQNDTNLGPVLNWKNCLDHAKGEFIHWLWSDDWIEHDFYNDAFNLMSSDGTDVVSTWNYRSDNPNDMQDKYISWQCSLSILPGEVAAKKILLSTGELPVSPTAYILKHACVKDNFFLNIPDLDGLSPVNKAVGVDSLMVAGCLLSQKKVSILRKPSVVFRKHENISTILSKDGSLSKMYFISHLWFLSNSDIRCTFSDLLHLFYRALRVYKFGLVNLTILKFVAENIMKLSINKRSFLNVSNRYRSKKAYFKK